MATGFVKYGQGYYDEAGYWVFSPSGMVSVVDTISGSTVASGIIDANGNALLSWTAAPGSYNFVVKYGGDNNFNPGKSSAIPFVVTAG